jgi:hypothetical protein
MEMHTEYKRQLLDNLQGVIDYEGECTKLLQRVA